MYISDSEINEQENFCKNFYNKLYQIFKSGNIKGIFDKETSSDEFTFKIIPEIDEIMTIKNAISNVSSKNSFKSYVLTKINTPNINACIKVQNRISENNKPYLTITIFTSHSIGIDWNNTNNIKLKMYNPYRNIIIHENKSISFCLYRRNTNTAFQKYGASRDYVCVFGKRKKCYFKYCVF